MVVRNDRDSSVALNRFEQQLQAKGLQGRTIRAYLNDADQFLIWLEEAQGCPAEMVSSAIAQAYLDYLSTPTPNRPAGYAANTIARKLKSLRYFYDSLDQA